ncbi:MAG: NYN domain-containing protein [Desulfobacteraceae bacterium]|nr:NYN domain-containing protein [Desulfobacteraceae bacterium]
MEERDRIALFIDLDNFVGSCLDDDLPIDLKGEIKKLTEHGRISIRRSFGDIMKLPMSHEKKQDLRQMLQANLVLHEDIPHYNKYKNTSDIRLAIETLSVAYTYPDINLFAIVANDRDFMPLFSKLKEIGKTVIGIGSTKDSVGELYKSACDLFYYHESLCETGLPAGMKPLTGQPSDEETEVIQLLLETVEFNSANAKQTLGCVIAPAMRARKPDLDFKNYSFLTFKGLCEAAEKKGLIMIEPHGGDINISCNESIVRKTFLPKQNGDLRENNLKQVYQRFIQDMLKLKSEFPDHGKRNLIYKKMDELLGESSGGIPLKELSEEVTKELDLKNEEQPSVYKILYTLYRAEGFLAVRSDDNYNPTIQRSIMDHKEMELNLIRRLIRLFKKDRSGYAFDPQQWSELFAGNTSYARIIKFAFNYE